MEKPSRKLVSIGILTLVPIFAWIAEHVLTLLKKHQMQRIILITSPFHQLRTYLTFARVFHPYGIEIINYSADPVRLKCTRT